MFEGIRTPRGGNKPKEFGDIKNGEEGQRLRIASILELAESGDVHGRRYTEGLNNSDAKVNPQSEPSTNVDPLPELNTEFYPLPEPNYYDENSTSFLTMEDALAGDDDEFSPKEYFKSPKPFQDEKDAGKNNSFEAPSIESLATQVHDVVQPVRWQDSRAFNDWLEEKIQPVEPSKGPDDVAPASWTIPGQIVIQIIREKINPIANDIQDVQGESSSQPKEEVDLLLAPVDEDLEALKEKYPPGTLFTITSTTGEVIDAVVRSHDRDVSSDDLVIRALYLNKDDQVKLIKIFDPKPNDAIRNAVGNPRDFDEVKKFLSDVRKDKKELAERRLRINAMSERVDEAVAAETEKVNEAMATEDEFEVPMDDM